MLKFNVNDEKNRFIIDFDVPVDPESIKHVEFKSLTNAFMGKGGCSFDINDNGELTKIQGSATSFIEVIDEILPQIESAAQKNILNDLLKKDTLQKESLQVNFHQNPFDTSRRYWNFILNQGSFTDYFFNRINWYAGPKNGYITPFPLHVDIESASTCNMNCPMCYRDQLKDNGQMDYVLFKKAVDECAENNVFSVRLSWRGETLTHPRIKEMIAYATRKIKNVSFLTNAFYIDEDMADCFIENKVSYVAVSFDGIGDVYEAIRNPAKFETSYQVLTMLKNKKEKANSKLPQVRLCTIWPAIKNDPDDYYNTMKDVSDYIVCNPYINFKGKMKIKPNFICQYPWERIVIGFNGNAQCCTGWNPDDIILGNISEQSIYDMWHSDMLNAIRKTHAAGRRMQLNSCADCRHGSEGDPDIEIRDIIGRGF